MGKVVSGPDELLRRTSADRAAGRRVQVVAARFAPLRIDEVRQLERARTEGSLVVAAVIAASGAEPSDEERAAIVAALASVDYALVADGEALRARLDDPPESGTHVEPGELVSWRPDREVFDQGDRFRKNFSTTRARDAELKRIWLLKAAGVNVPEILACPENSIVTARLPGVPLDQLIATRWLSLSRSERNRLIDRVAAVCRKIRDGGFNWPDLVTYHIFVSEDRVFVLDPPRLRRGRLDLSPLHFSTEEPTVSRTDRLHFWRAYAGKARPRLRDIGHRGRFRPYRWVCERTEIRAVPRFARFVNAIGAPFASADELADDPRLEIWRRMDDRVNARLDNLFVKIVTDPEQAKLEWNCHRWLIQAGFRCPQPAVGGILEDGRGLFSSVRLEGQLPMDEVWATLDHRTAVRAVADVTRRLHACGLVHRDLYLNHFYIHPGGQHPALVDLGRVQRTTARRMRIKDLTALYVSARGLCSRTDLWRGLKRYGGGKSEARAVLRKARRMARHVPKKIRDGSHTREPP